MSSGPTDLTRVVAQPLRLSLPGRAAAGDLALDELAAEFDITERKVAEAVGRPQTLHLNNDDRESAIWCCEVP